MFELEGIHRLHFAFTITFHYIFPQVTMGMALLIFILKTMGLRGNAEANRAVRFWTKIFGVTFVMGVVTGIPMEFQFGTNWSRFAEAAGGIVGQTLAMEGIFAFFLESSFIYLLLFGEKRLGRWGHWTAALLVFVGSWLSGFFIVCTNAWMQHPVGHEVLTTGGVTLTNLYAVLSNPWAILEYSHTIIGATITGSFVMAGISAFYLLQGRHQGFAKRSLSVSVLVGFIASLLVVFPTGDFQAKWVNKHKPAAFAGMEGLFKTEKGAGLVIIGQPNVEEMRIDNAIVVPKMLSLLTHHDWDSEVIGLDKIEKDQWPGNIPLLFYSYHVMFLLGMAFVGVMTLSAILLKGGRLYRQRWLLWILMLAFPFPIIANTAGWTAAELGRQPWIIYGVMRTAEGYSDQVSPGNALFTLIGFVGLYTLLSILYLFVTTRIIARGPEGEVT